MSDNFASNFSSGLFILQASDLDGEGDEYQEIRPPFDSDDMIFHMEDFPTGGEMALHTSLP